MPFALPETQLRELFEAHPQPMWVYDVETLRFVSVNDAALAQYGYSRDEFLDMTLKDIRPESEVSALIQDVKLKTQGRVSHRAWTHRTKEGRTIHVEIASRGLEVDGRSCRLVLARDLTPWLEAQEERQLLLNRERQARCEADNARATLKAIFESVPGLFLVLEPGSFQIVDVSDAYLQATMTTRAAIVGQSLFDVFPDNPSDSQPGTMHNLRISLERVAATRARDVMPVQRYAVRRPTSEGEHLEERYWSPINAPVLSPDGRLVFITHRVEDVTDYILARGSSPSDPGGPKVDLATEWMEAEVLSRARELQELSRRVEDRDRLLAIAGRAAKIGGWLANIADGMVHWSDEVCAIHEAPPGTTVTIQDGISYYAPEWRPVITEAFRACVQHGTPYDLELEIIGRRGRRVWVRAIGEGVRDADGVITSVQGAFQDISASKKVKAEVSRLEQRLTRTLESMTDAFFILDPHWRFTYVNRMAETLLQRSRQELIGCVVWDEFPEAVASTFETAYRRAVETGKMVSFEEFFAPLNLWATVRAYPSEEGLAIHFQDTTAQRAAQAALRESEERFRIVGRATADVLWDWNVQTDGMWWSDGVQRVFGYSPGELEPRGSSWISRIHPDDRERVVSGIRRVTEGPEEKWEDTYRFRRSDGTFAHVRDRGFLVRAADGTVTRMLGGTTDETEQHRTRERIREQASLLDQARDAILVVKLDDTVTFWNKGAERLYGWTAEEVNGRSVLDLVCKPNPLCAGIHTELLERGEWSGELSHVTKNGSDVTVEARFTLVRDENGQPHRILCINTDVTQQRKIQAHFARAQRMESIGTLAGGIAHDLNNTLTPIMMAIDLLKSDAKDEGTRETLATLEESTVRAAAMVKQVLVFARGMDGTRAEVRVDRLVDSIGKLVRDTFPKSITFKADVPDGIWPLRADPTQCHQILLNLCVNARDAMPTGGMLLIAAENMDIDAPCAARIPGTAPGPYVRFQVVDTGTGIPAELLDRIFDPFFSTKPVGEGTGLGLSTLHSIVRGHGGFVTVESEAGKGTTFTFCLPATRSAVEGEQPQRRPAPPRGSRELILVIDDEAAVRAIAQQTLEASGYQVITAADGAEALALYARHEQRVALVLTDMRMPTMGGAATVQALKRMNPDVKIVVASGHHSHERAAADRPSDIIAFVPKPYTAGKLLSVVHSALHTVTPHERDFTLEPVCREPRAKPYTSAVSAESTKPWGRAIAFPQHTDLLSPG